MEFKKWLDSLLEEIPDGLVAFNLNLYETDDENLFDAQLVGCNQYDLEDEDWACDVAYSSEENILSFEAEDWEKALEIALDEMKAYLDSAEDGNKIKKAEYVTAGFVDGNLEVVYSK